MAKKMKTYHVPVDILEKRTMTVRAHTADDARARAQAGQYVRLGRPESRGVLIYHDAEEVKPDGA